jgi:hypothetical protein
MNRVIVDPLTQAQLVNAQQKLELCDDSGRILGHFIPVEDRSSRMRREPQISDEEIERRVCQGGGRPLAEILTDLEKKA